MNSRPEHPAFLTIGNLTDDRRILNVLQRRGITYAGQLCFLSFAFLEGNGLGRKSVNLLRVAMISENLSIGSHAQYRYSDLEFRAICEGGLDYLRAAFKGELKTLEAQVADPRVQRVTAEAMKAYRIEVPGAAPGHLESVERSLTAVIALALSAGQAISKPDPAKKKP